MDRCLNRVELWSLTQRSLMSHKHFVRANTRLRLKANSHMPCRSMQRPCRDAKGSDCVCLILITQCGRVWVTHAMPRAAVFDSHMPCRAHALPRPCRSESDFSSPRHGGAWARHDICELTSAVQRRHVGDLPAFGFFRLPRRVPRRLLSEA
jgi:hypothetical protein